MLDVFGMIELSDRRIIYKLMRADDSDDFSFLDNIKEGMLYWNFICSVSKTASLDQFGIIMRLQPEVAFIIKYDEERIIREPICSD